ncbi:TIGR03016 family PEP-CTERM system-associated outer membrane protein [Kineobactrum sediminis]|uniref:TIGR03016 family PEP-CTERM system-associated outer membrane protein n=1 Tax=Kineobactrum sediminis TaxID=1905677 RepID=A0A2N5XZG3_9GAMM|nr:TIGR03016 family PEP-CTERM system-associated outer membrane protein [Kineobactrum sediminis]PLW81535.1 TIGR03016 family PEP-CTERM system-associated outer membrane protein [Kineobactrum sediminis]
MSKYKGTVHTTLHVTLHAALLGSALLAQGTSAAEWETEAGISLGGYYSDNICLAPTDEEGKAVATARPDISLQGTGARGNVSLQAAAEVNSLGESNLDCATGQGGQLTNRESVVPSLRFNADYELIQDWLQLEADASARRNPINPFAPGGEDSINGRENTSILYDYGVGALLQRRIARAALLRLRYNYNEQFNNVGLFGDSSEDRVQFDLDTLPDTGRISAGIGGRYSRISYDSSDLRPAFDNELSSAEFRLGLQLTSSWQVNGLVGEEWNEFTSVRDDIDGSFWDAGIRWTPNSRVEVAAGTGERFFGSTPRLDISYRHKRSLLTASYTRTISFPRNLRGADSDFTDPDDPFGPGFGDLPGDPLTGDGLQTFIGDTPVLDERLTLSYRFTGRRTNFTLSGSDSRQERTEDLSEATFRSVNFTATRTLSSKLSADFRLGWSENEGQGPAVGSFGQNAKTWRGGFGFTRRIGNDTSVNVAYQYVTRDSDFAFNNYNENRITFSVRFGF